MFRLNAAKQTAKAGIELPVHKLLLNNCDLQKPPMAKAEEPPIGAAEAGFRVGF